MSKQEPTQGRKRRDTHFRGFAKLLLTEMLELYGYIDLSTGWFEIVGEGYGEEYIDIIARRAYDLVEHTILHVDPYHLDALSYEEIPARIPDMAIWPKEET